MSSHLDKANKYFAAIDGMRAVAVIGVILFHFNANWLPGGFSGVDVFFVISGYVVTGSLYKDIGLTLGEFIRNFYARRIIRIFPALLVCVLLTSIVQVLVVPTSWLSNATNKTALFSIFGFSNAALVLYSDGYFSPRVEFNAFTHTWSLGVEEQFYILFPLVFYFWIKSESKGVRNQWFFKSIFPVLWGSSLIYCAIATSKHPQLAYYMLPSRFWELGVGAGLFILHKRGVLLPKTETAASALQALGVVLIAGSLYFSVPSQFPFPWAILAVLGSALTIAGSVYDRQESIGRVNGMLDNPLMVLIGRLSYSLYLWHWPVLAIFRWTVGVETLPQIASAFVLIAVLSYFSFIFVEKPVRQSSRIKSNSSGFIVSRGLVVAATGFALIFAIFKAQPIVSLSRTSDIAAWYPMEWRPELNAAANKDGRFSGHRMFVLGDSHAGAYGTLLQKLVKSDGLEVQVYSMAGCPVANLISIAKQDCAEFVRRSVADIVAKSRPGDIVFLPSLRMRRLGDQWISYDVEKVVSQQLSEEAERARAAALNEASQLIAQFEQHSLNVIMDAPKPVFRSPPFRCSDRFNQSNAVCKGGMLMDRDFLLNHRSAAMKELETLKNGHRALRVWDNFSLLCPSETCSAFVDSKPLFFDGDHLSGYANEILYPSFVALLSDVWSAKRS